MSKELYIAATPHETKVAIVEDDQLTEVYYERENEYTLAGSIYKGKVTRVLPGMQSSFVDIGLERDAFLYVTDFMEEEEQDEYVVTQAPVVSHDREREKDSEERPTRRRDQEEAVESGDAGEVGAEANASAAGDSAGAQRSGEDRGPRRWRGRRGRRRGRGEFREARPESAAAEGGEPTEGVPETVEAVEQEEIRHSRHEEPRSESRHAHRREANVDTHSNASHFVLPGETISKYRPEGEAVPESRPHAEAPARPVSTFRPSTEVTDLPVAGWSGGNTLPGESLSKYRGSRPTAVSEPPAPVHVPAVESHEEIREERVPYTPERRVTEAAQESFHGNIVDTPAPVNAAPVPKPKENLRESEDRQQPIEIQIEQRQPDALAGERAAEPHATKPWFAFWHRREEPEVSPRNAANVNEFAREEVEEIEEVEEEESSARQIEAQQETETGHVAASADEAPAARHGAEAPSGPAQQGFARHEGQIEEEEIDEEEYEFSHFMADDDADLEEMEEETLAANSGVEIGEAVRDAHLEERVRGFEDTEELEEEVEGTDGAEPVEAEAQGEVSEDDAEYEGQAELRAPADTAAFQQRPERSQQDRERRFGRRRGGGRRQRGGAGGGSFGRQQHRQIPTISELLHEGQEILVQIAKEPIAKKGARITSHIALPGRFLVFMPTVNHVGVSRKISSDEERQRLKRILLSEKGTVHGGFIVRTAAGGASEEDLRADIRFLINLWTEIKSRSDNSKSPALIYHDLNLVERILRDQVSANFSTVWVDSEQEYERVLRFLNRFQPSLVRRVKLYTKETPLFEQFGIQEEINKALKSKVWLKSGGYIVINQTEALVAIDVNTGKYVGKTQRLEDTIVKTNVDAIQEIVRQIRLRDLGGIIVIDFIDMDERKNRHRVMQALEEALKLDRAPSKVLQFNDFGLVVITRKRVKQSLERTLSTQCSYCTGTGMVKSPTTVCNEIYTEMRKMSKHLEGHDVLLRVHPEIVKALKSNNSRWLNDLEELAHRTIIVKSDPTLHMEQFDIH